MKLIPLKDITIKNRQRREFDPQTIQELAESIEKLGLLNPITVRREDGAFRLVAGERRLRAIETVWALGGQFSCAGARVVEGLVPALDVGDFSDVNAFEAELDENIRRADLSWQERADSIARLHELRGSQTPGHTIAETAVEVLGKSDGIHTENVRQQILVARHLADPEVARAGSFRDAFKIILRKEEMQDHALRAAIVGETFDAHSHTVMKGDCLLWMDHLEEGKFDVIITDPPYGMGADEFGDAAGKLTTITHDYIDSVGNFRGLMEKVAPRFARVAKPAAHLYMCCDLDQFHYLRDLFTRIGGWNVFRTPIINHKVGSGRVPLPEHGPRRTYEIILYAFRGDKRVTAIYPDLLDSRGDDNYGHGAQKPVELYADLLRRSVRPGDSVLDPFCGTGTVFPAAHQLRVYATGIELEPAYYGIAVKRIEELK